MSKLASKTIKALRKLGLDLDTGVSKEISLNKLEQFTKDRHVSNGCKIIRDDSFPFSCFKIERNYTGPSLSTIRFIGYRDVGYEVEIIKDKIIKLNKKSRSFD